MIIAVTVDDHQYTHEPLDRGRHGVDMRVATYKEVAAMEPSEDATYLFLDLDRHTGWSLREAGVLYRRLVKEGRRVLNDPARAMSRQGLLRRLHHEGLNDFDAYRVEECVTPKRWPVFLRTEGDHDWPATRLIRNEEQLKEIIAKCVELGFPLSSLIIIEYVGEPVRPGLFRKLSMFRIGNRYVGYFCGHDTGWLVKVGKVGIAPLELYDEEYRFIEDDTFADVVAPAFEMSGIEYGRIDFGFYKGRPQMFEINSNPYVRLWTDKVHPVQRRNESVALFRDKYLAAMAALDPAGRA